MFAGPLRLKVLEPGNENGRQINVPNQQKRKIYKWNLSKAKD